jgi:hypothetical protein
VLRRIGRHGPGALGATTFFLPRDLRQDVAHRLDYYYELATTAAQEWIRECVLANQSGQIAGFTRLQPVSDKDDDVWSPRLHAVFPVCVVAADGTTRQFAPRVPLEHLGTLRAIWTRCLRRAGWTADREAFAYYRYAYESRDWTSILRPLLRPFPGWVRRAQKIEYFGYLATRREVEPDNSRWAAHPGSTGHGTNSSGVFLDSSESDNPVELWDERPWRDANPMEVPPDPLAWRDPHEAELTGKTEMGDGENGRACPTGREL